MFLKSFQVLLGLLIISLTTAVFAANPFDSFLGTYIVVKQQCYQNDEPTTNCQEKTEVKLAYDEKNILRIYEYDPSSIVGYPIDERNYSDQFGYTKAIISSDSSSATWSLTERYRQFAGPEYSELDEQRIFSRSKNNVSYEFYHREKDPLTREWSISKILILQAKH